MTSTNEGLIDGQIDGQIIKTDSRGRTRTSVERRKALVAEYEGSGMSGAGFAKLKGIKETKVAGWVKRQRKEKRQEGQKTPVKSPMRWVEAIVEAGGESK